MNPKVRRESGRKCVQMLVAYGVCQDGRRELLSFMQGRKRDRDELKKMAQAIYLADDRKQARASFRCFKLRWQAEYPTMVKQLEKDLPDLLAFFSFQNICGNSCAPPILSSAAL